MESVMEQDMDEVNLKTELVTITSERFPVIMDDAGYDIVAQNIKKAKQFLDKVDAKKDENISKAFQLHRSLCQEKKELRTPAELYIKLGEAEIQRWKDEQNIKAKAESERLMALQRKQAEDAKMTAAVEAQRSGDLARAEAILNQPTIVAPVVVFERKAGEIEKIEWTWWLTSDNSKFELVKAVAEGRAPMALISINEAEMKKGVGFLKISNPYPGIGAKAVSKTIIKK